MSRSQRDPDSLYECDRASTPKPGREAKQPVTEVWEVILPRQAGRVHLAVSLDE
jgi:hypothetical protein